MTSVDPEGIHKAIGMAHNASFVICGRFLKHGTAVSFIPDNPQKYGEVQDQKRIIFYSLCSECSQTPESYKRAEEIIKLEIDKGRIS
jgi:hypothetical protein